MEIKTKPVEVTMFEFALTEQQVEYLQVLLNKSQIPYDRDKIVIYRGSSGDQATIRREDLVDFHYEFESELVDAQRELHKQRETKAKAAKAEASAEKKASAPKKASTKSAPTAAAAKPRKANGTWTCPGCGRQIGSMGKGRHTSTCQKYIAQAKAATGAKAAVHTTPGQLDDEVEAEDTQYQERICF